MAGDIKGKYGTSAGITITLASLASGSARQSDAIDLSSSTPRDILAMIAPKLGSGTLSGQKAVNVYVSGSIDGGTTYGGGLTGSDGSYSMGSPTVLQLWAVIPYSASGTAMPCEPCGVAWAFRNALPPKVAFVVENQTGIAFSATEGDHVKTYLPVLGQYT